MIRITRCAATLAVVLLPAIAQAQGAEPDTTVRGHIWPALGVRFGTPQKASAALGVVLGETWRTTNGHDHSRNLALFAEPGLSAGRGTLAYIDHGYGSFGSGFGVGATVMRTWKDPWGAPDNVTYVGGEAILWPILFVGPRLGVFHAVSGQTSKRWIFTIDIGIGL